MATTVHEPPKIEERRDQSRPASNSGNGGWRNLVPADGDLRAVKDYSPPPASTGIWVVLASITMTLCRVHQRLDRSSRVGAGLAASYSAADSLPQHSGALRQQRCAGGGAPPGRRLHGRAEEIKSPVQLAGCTSRCSWDCFLWPVSTSRGCNCARRAFILATNPNSSFFYVLTAVHALHVLGRSGRVGPGHSQAE